LAENVFVIDRRGGLAVVPVPLVLPDAPVLLNPAVANPALAEPVLANPALAEPVLAEPVLAEPVLAEPLEAPVARLLPEVPA
jgi:hypothetical protein